MDIVTPAAEGRIVASGLTKVFGGVKAVDGLSFEVEQGSVTGFLGSNGAGKTTTLRMILGLAKPTSGVGTISGVEYAHLHAPGRTVGAVLEANSFYPTRSARNHLLVLCAAAGVPDTRADAVLEIVGLTSAAKLPVRGYSLGMRQRLGLASALIGDPKVLLLDEPSNGLDPEGIVWLRGFLRQLADAEGRTVLISSHVLAEVQQAVDRVVIIAKGRLVYEGGLKELEGDSADVVVRTPTLDALTAALAPLKAKISARPDGSVTVAGTTLAAVGHAAWDAQVELHELSEDRPSLEDAFLRLTKDSTNSPGVDG